jgi:hypothetical protein
MLGSAALLGLAVLALTVAARDQPSGTASADRCVASGAVPTLGATVLHTSPTLALPTRLELVGNRLVVLDAAAESVLHVVDRETGLLLQSLGRRGRGPGEFYGAWALDADRPGDAAVWVYDLSLRRLTLVPLTSEGGTGSSTTMIHLTDGRLVTGTRWLDPNTIVAAGLLSDARVALYDGAGHHVESLGAPPALASSGLPMQAGQAQLELSPDGSAAVLARRYVSNLEIVTLPSGTARTIDGPVGVRPGGRSTELDRFAYVDLTVTAGAIMALFSGREARLHGSRAPFGRCLHLFDWQGGFTAAFALDTDVLAIASDPDGQFVYALRHDPVPAVVRFALPPTGSSQPVGRRGTGVAAR